MIDKVLKAVRDKIQETFPDLTVVEHWPSKDEKIKYPYMLLFEVNTVRQNYPENFLGEVREEQPEQQPDKVYKVFSVGEWRTRLDLSFFAYTKEEITVFSSQFLDFFQSSSNGLANRSIVVPFGNEKYEICDFGLLDSVRSAPAKHKRVIFRTQLNYPDLVRKDQPYMTDIQLKGSVSEKETAL